MTKLTNFVFKKETVNLTTPQLVLLILGGTAVCVLAAVGFCAIFGIK